MEHKIVILDIEHVEYAGRIIIRYQLLWDTANYNSPGWLYISDGCGYRDICSNEWMCIEPNTQHPLHSDTIKQAGVYYFVWDYHGINGLSNEDFSSERSFLIQLALQDSGVGWVDPCIEDPNLSPLDGSPVTGDVGTQGNCGEGYLIDLDWRGCPICVKQDDPPGTTGDYAGTLPPITGTSVPPGPPPPPPKIPKNPLPKPPFITTITPIDGGTIGAIGSEGYGDTNDQGGGGTTETTLHRNYFTKPTVGDNSNGGGNDNDDNIPGVEDIPPEATNLDRGLVIKFESVGSDGSPLGHIPPWMVQNTPDDSDGDGTYNIGVSKITTPATYLDRGYFAGKSPHINNITNLYYNQRYNQYIINSYGKSKIAPSENEANITTRHFRTASNTINSTANKQIVRSKSMPSNAISVSSMTAKISSPTSASLANSILRRTSTKNKIQRETLASVNQADKSVESRAAKFGIHKEDGVINTKPGSANRKPTTSSFERNITVADRSPKRLVNTRDKEKAELFNLVSNDNSFTNLNRVGLSCVPKTGPVGSNFYATCYAIPHDKNNLQTFTLSLYIKDSAGKTEKVASTNLESTVGMARRIAATIGTSNLSSGRAIVYFVAKDSTGYPIFTKGQPIYLYPPGQIVGMPDRAISNSGVSSGGRNFISGLTKKGISSSIDIPIGGGNSPARLLADLTKTSGVIELGAQTISLRGRKHHILNIYDGFVSNHTSSTGKILSAELFAANSLNNYGQNIFGTSGYVSSALYQEVDYSRFSEERDFVLITISNTEDTKLSYVTLEVGGDLTLKETYIYSTTNNGDGTYTFVMYTPFCSTDLIAFQAGGNNIISSDSSTVGVTTNTGGKITSLTIALDDNAWLALALKEPSNAPLASRTFFFEQI